MKLFGTDGIRGRAGEYPLNAIAITAIGHAIAEKLGGTVLVGRDTRASCPWILSHLEKGFKKAGVAIDDAGVIPTPAIALLTREGVRDRKYAGGVMISASHNPFEDNGIKVFSWDGTKLTDSFEGEIEQRIVQLLPPDSSQTTNYASEFFPAGDSHRDYAARYQELLLSHFEKRAWLKGLRIMVDCANGAMSVVAPDLLRRLGAEVSVICAAPDGRNINENCGAVHLDRLSQAMRNGEADFGVAFDGDGDRSLFVSHNGRSIDGDAVLLVMARRIRPVRVIGTSMTNYALEMMLRETGVALTRVAVGDRYVFEEMQRTGAPLGGEPSGHLIFSDFRLSGDGLLTTLKLAQVIVEEQKSLDDLTADWLPAPQLLKGVRVSRKVPLEQMSALHAVMGAANAALEGCGRLVVRYSGTEPLLRVMIESDDSRRNEEWMGKLLGAITQDFENLG